MEKQEKMKIEKTKKKYMHLMIIDILFHILDLEKTK